MKFKNFRLFLLGLLVVSTTSFAETKNKPTIPSNNQYEQQNKISKETLFAKLSLSKDQKLKLNNAFSEFEKASNSLSSSKNQDFSAIRGLASISDKTHSKKSNSIKLIYLHTQNKSFLLFFSFPQVL